MFVNWRNNYVAWGWGGSWLTDKSPWGWLADPLSPQADLP